MVRLHFADRTRAKLFVEDNQPPNQAFGGCPLLGIPLSGGRHLSNLGMTRVKMRHKEVKKLIRSRVYPTSVHINSNVRFSDMEV